MTVEVVYELPRPRVQTDWQTKMAQQIEENRGFPVQNIKRELHGTRFVIRVETNLPDAAVENMLGDIEPYLEPRSEHLVTREV